ncbi:hypothetical protein NHE_0082 [Neorickettsia helminthoeca str. Oregon]|uniref:Transmembrane protein n=1 Tax=Neorickettsia helminthoeca str. Oregon TaxID=1286528 RepID=X5H313_9RICK|nr:hypothetical protein [Neorickettsia helminthoeca]AHX11053.1 hypothetical protein NHE_0082 [Neorickettsia helminthoeca str. Oregon]
MLKRLIGGMDLHNEVEDRTGQNDGANSRDENEDCTEGDPLVGGGESRGYKCVLCAPGVAASLSVSMLLLMAAAYVVLRAPWKDGDPIAKSYHVFPVIFAAVLLAGLVYLSLFIKKVLAPVRAAYREGGRVGREVLHEEVRKATWGVRPGFTMVCMAVLFLAAGTVFAAFRDRCSGSPTSVDQVVCSVLELMCASIAFLAIIGTVSLQCCPVRKDPGSCYELPDGGPCDNVSCEPVGVPQSSAECCKT